MFYDYLIIGGGIVGLSVARCLINNFPNAKILLLEKEADVALHSSGRNSGVLHAGFYYTADSLKAKFPRNGNMQLREYCYDNNLKINECKKVVVAKNEDEIEFLNFKIPSWNKLTEAVINLHDSMSGLRFLSWDITTDENGEPVLIEVNLRSQDINTLQIPNGPLFGNFTKDVLDWYKEWRKIIK